MEKGYIWPFASVADIKLSTEGSLPKKIADFYEMILQTVFSFSIGRLPQLTAEYSKTVEVAIPGPGLVSTSPQRSRTMAALKPGFQESLFPISEMRGVERVE